VVQKTPEGGERPYGSQKRQRSPGGTPSGGHSKRPKQTGQLSYARAAQEDVRLAIVCEGYTGHHISRDNFVDIQRAIGLLVDVLPQEEVTHRLFDSYWAKERPLWFTRIRTPRSGWRVRHPLWRHGRAQAQICGLGCSPHIQENGGLVSGLPGGHGAAFVAAP